MLFTATQMYLGYGALQLRPYPWAVVSFLGMIGLPYFAWVEAQRHQQTPIEGTVFPRNQFGRHTLAQDTPIQLTAEQRSIAKADGRYRYDVKRGGNMFMVYFPYGITRPVLSEFSIRTFDIAPTGKATQDKLCGTGKPFQNNNKELAPGLKPPLPAFLTWFMALEDKLDAEWFTSDNELTRDAQLALKAFTKG